MDPRTHFEKHVEEEIYLLKLTKFERYIICRNMVEHFCAFVVDALIHARKLFARTDSKALIMPAFRQRHIDVYSAQLLSKHLP